MRYHLRPLMIILALGPPGLLTVGCGGWASSKQLQFVIPDDFHGPFALSEGRNGIVLDANQKMARIAIPKSGVVVVTSGSALREMRQWSALTVSGKAIGVYEVGDNDVALRGGGWAARSGQSPRFEFFVGTLEEFEAFDFVRWNPRD